MHTTEDNFEVSVVEMGCWDLSGPELGGLLTLGIHGNFEICGLTESSAWS